VLVKPKAPLPLACTHRQQVGKPAPQRARDNGKIERQPLAVDDIHQGEQARIPPAGIVVAQEELHRRRRLVEGAA
jgi:hypothetical protein